MIGLQLLVLHWGESNIKQKVTINPKLKGIGKVNICPPGGRHVGRLGTRGGSGIGGGHRGGSGIGGNC